MIALFHPVASGKWIFFFLFFRLTASPLWRMLAWTPETRYVRFCLDRNFRRKVFFFFRLRPGQASVSWHGPLKSEMLGSVRMLKSREIFFFFSAAPGTKVSYAEKYQSRPGKYYGHLPQANIVFRRFPPSRLWSHLESIWTPWARFYSGYS